MTNTDACNERHKALNTLLKYVISGVLGCFISLGGAYLYAAETYVRKDSLSLLRAEIKSLKHDMSDRLERIEKRLSK